MNHQRIALGLAAWFLGIIVPVGHHIVACLLASITRQSALNPYDLYRFWEALHWVEWVYMGLMAFVGLLLIRSGLTHPAEPRRNLMA